jgi:ankyrin repeat protein
MTEGNRSDPIRTGLTAWAQGDLDALEAVLDPSVTLRAMQRGPWDCENREQLMALLRQREAGRAGDPRAEVEVQQVDESTFIVAGIGGGPGLATRVTVNGGKVVAMQQISTEQTDADTDAAVAAIRAGDSAALARILADRPDLARAPAAGFQGRTMLHVATDWPGYLPNGPEIVRVLIDHGADPNHRGGDGRDGETPLHWAASSDDVDVARALLDGGADPEAPDGSIGTPLDNAIGYGCWNVAHLLAASGASIDKLWHAAALGRLDLVETLLASSADGDQISQAFWHACAASQRRAAERLLTAGADLDWKPDYAEGNALDAAIGRSTRQENVIEWLVALGATPASAPG